jgi:beta-xylosidase
MNVAVKGMEQNAWCSIIPTQGLDFAKLALQWPEPHAFKTQWTSNSTRKDSPYNHPSGFRVDTLVYLYHMNRFTPVMPFQPTSPYNTQLHSPGYFSRSTFYSNKLFLFYNGQLCINVGSNATYLYNKVQLYK